MFNWVVKVVPQPPEAPVIDQPVKVAAPVKPPPKPKEVPRAKTPPLKTAEENSLDSQQSGVLGWLSNGFVSALPQPAGSPRLTRADGEKGSAVFKWVSQGLNNMLPQPDEKYRETPEVYQEEHTEVYEVEAMPDFDPLPHIPVVELVSEDEGDESSTFPANVSKWIKQMMPQPTPPGTVTSETPNSHRSSLDKTLSPPPESLSGISLDTDGKAGNMVGWFMSGFGLKMPQPALQSKVGAGGATEVLQKGGKVLRAP